MNATAEERDPADEPGAGGPAAVESGTADDAEHTYDPVAISYWDHAADFPPLVKQNLLYRFVHFMARWVFRWYFQIELIGGDKIPTNGPVILAASHRSNIDTPFLGLTTRRPVNFMAKQQFFKTKWSLRLFRRLGAFPVNREAPDKDALKRALEVLGAGGVLGIYPEGTRRDGAKIGEVLRGPAWLAVKSQATVVPVGIGGSAAVQPKGSSKISPAKVRIVIGDPIKAPPGRGKQATDEFTTQLVESLQAAFDAAGGVGPLERVPRAQYSRGY